MSSFGQYIALFRRKIEPRIVLEKDCKINFLIYRVQKTRHIVSFGLEALNFDAKRQRRNAVRRHLSRLALDLSHEVHKKLDISCQDAA